jgi:hypothetical protein
VHVRKNRNRCAQDKIVVCRQCNVRRPQVVRNDEKGKKVLPDDGCGQDIERQSAMNQIRDERIHQMQQKKFGCTHMQNIVWVIQRAQQCMSHRTSKGETGGKVQVGHRCGSDRLL